MREYAPSAERPTYVALSYAWWDPGPILILDRSSYRTTYKDPDPPSFSASDSEALILNGKMFRIRANLHSALCGLHVHLAGRPIWVDAVCINQQDGLEKTAQVARMDQIYKEAEDVFIWLGQKHSIRDRALTILDRWPVFPEDPQRADIHFHGRVYQTAGSFFDATSLGSEIVSWIFLFTIIAETWWSRVWTIQEFILAKSYTFFYDSRAVPTAQLRSAMSWVTYIAARSPCIWLPQWLTIQPPFFALQDSWREHGQPLDLLDCVLLGSTRIATDPRDKVFAFLGITDPASIRSPDGTKLETNYVDRDLSRLYYDVAKCLLFGKAGLSILSLVAHALPQSFMESMPSVKKAIGDRIWAQHLIKKRGPPPNPSFEPMVEDVFAPTMQPNWSGALKRGEFVHSWVPKLSTTIVAVPLFQREMRAADAVGSKLWDPSWRLFRAASSLRAEFALSNNGDFLLIQAWKLCTIRSATLLPQPQKKEVTKKRSSNLSQFWCTVRSWFPEKYLRDVVCAPASTTLFETLWRTLLANIWLRTHPAPSAVADYFASWLAGTNMSARDVKKEFGLACKPNSDDSDIFMAALDEAGLLRTLFIAAADGDHSDRRYLGLGPAVAQNGDVVMLIAGTHVPYVLRKQTSNSDVWVLVGEAYVHGAMYGEALVDSTPNFEGIRVM